METLKLRKKIIKDFSKFIQSLSPTIVSLPSTV
jgi:hypothetical protein